MRRSLPAMSDSAAPVDVKPVEAVAPAADAAAAAPAAAAEPAAAAAASEDSSAAKEEEVEQADSTAEYQPVVQLKPVEVATGEEQDEVLYKQRSACYRFDAESSSWKERGRGDVKLLQNKDTGIIRVLLRQEKTLKLCMNHKVHPELDLTANAGSDRSWTWRTVDYSTDEGEKQTFALRFKDAETAQAFKAEFDKAKQHNVENDKKRAAEKPAESS